MDEQGLRDELYGLVRELHGKKQADEIIASFENAFAASADADERRSLIEHWRDFYRLRRYRRVMRRRRPTYKERMTACAACGYPASHRHHLWDVATHGENQVTIQLCANCHELQHLMYNALVRDSAYSQRLALHVLTSGRVAHTAMDRVLAWCRATIRYEAANGWTEAFRASDEWVNRTLHWDDINHNFSTLSSTGNTK